MNQQSQEENKQSNASTQHEINDDDLDAMLDDCS
jgi:hypothetical protein